MESPDDLPTLGVPLADPIGWSVDAEVALWSDICRKNFWWFLQVAWGAHWYMRANAHDRWVTERLHKPICDWLQTHVEDWERRRLSGEKRRTKLALVIPRSYGKTVIATKALPLWVQLRNPDLATYIGSETVEKAIDFLRPVKSVLDGSDPFARFTHLYGNWFSPERLWTNRTVVHAVRTAVGRSEPSFDTWGVEQGITGAHPDWGIFDDPISEEKLKESGAWIDAVNNAMAALRPAFRTDSFFMLVCTRYRDNDAVGKALSEEGVRSWTGMQVPEEKFQPRDDGEWDVYFLQALDTVGVSTFPEMWPTEELRRYEKSKPIFFAAQMMNDPASGEHMALTMEQVDQLWIEPKDLPSYMQYTLHMDTAFKLPTRAGRGDENVIEVWGHDPRGNGDVYYIEGFGSNTWRIEEFTDELLRLCQRYKRFGKRIRMMTDEREMGGKANTWEMWLRSSFAGAGITMPPLKVLNRSRGKKEVRIREAAGFWVDGHVRIVRGAPGAHKLVSQMVRLGVAAHDDWADAAADVFAPEVYRPMLNPALSGGQDDGAYPIQPGDDILGRRLSDEGARKLYDVAHGEWVDKFFDEKEEEMSRWAAAIKDAH
jgi:hypothetical protein